MKILNLPHNTGKFSYPQSVSDFKLLKVKTTYTLRYHEANAWREGKETKLTKNKKRRADKWAALYK